MERPPYPPNAPFHSSELPPPWWRDRLKVSLVAGVGILVIVAIVLFMVLSAKGGEGAVASATPSSSTLQSTPALPSATAIASGSSATPSATPSPSASSNPGTPQNKLAQGWARIDVGLNLRNGPGESSPIVRRLEQHEVVWINSDPERNDKSNWYYVLTLVGDSGWIASGPADDPYASNLSNRFVFSSCGQVSIAGHYGIVNGLRTARLNDFEFATFEIAIATDTGACVRYSFEDYTPTSRLALDVHACGAPVWDGSVFSLQPSTAGDVDAAWRVDATMVVSDLLLTDRQRIHEDGLTNHKKILILGSRLSSHFACVEANIIRKDTSRKDLLIADTTGCMVVTSKTRDTISFAPAGSGDALTFSRESLGILATIALNDPSTLRVVSAYRRLSSQLLGDC